jgi:hypothetical protein
LQAILSDDEIERGGFKNMKPGAAGLILLPVANLRVEPERVIGLD